MAKFEIFPHQPSMPVQTASSADGVELFLSAILIATVTLISRYLTRGTVYMVDGPRIVDAIKAGTYVIQPPGYWLYAHLGGLFPNPAFGLAFWNQIFSSLGAAVFFLLCRRMGCTRLTSWLSAFAYASIFYVWFAGDIHSSYASQVLFPPSYLYCMLLYRKEHRTRWLVACAFLFAVGSGLRPSDGAFMAPLMLFFGWKWVASNRQRVLFFASVVVLCLAWYIPTELALKSAHSMTYSGQLESVTTGRSVLSAALAKGAVLNVARVLLALIAAFWMVIPVLFRRIRTGITAVLLLWFLPGVMFFLIVYMADADYLVFCTGAILLLVSLLPNRRSANATLLVCALWNALLFLAARPIHGSGVAGEIFNFYIVKYCHYGIQHHWTSTLGTGGIVP